MLLGGSVVALSLWLAAPAEVAGAGAKATASTSASRHLPSSLSRHGGEFLSPSRNISCEIDWHVAGLSSVAYCQTFSPPRSVTISSSGRIKRCSGTRCVGNPAENAGVLPYLTSAGAGPFLCASRIDGVACSSAAHAFLISRSGVVTYTVLPHTTLELYTDPANHPTLPSATAYGWLLAVDRAGEHAEVEVECGKGPRGKLPADRLWTVDLGRVKSFEVETNPADERAGSVVEATRRGWVAGVRVHGWNGYIELRGADSHMTDGPGTFDCSR
ncbi:MAG: hypothetical protein ACRDXC_09080 [Acidimicrobiales bacterium]